MCKSIFVRIVVYFMVLKEKRYHGLLVCNWSLFFEKVKLDVRRSLEPFKRSQTPSNSTCVSRILDASV